jgi:hypothetical protein
MGKISDPTPIICFFSMNPLSQVVNLVKWLELEEEGLWALIPLEFFCHQILLMSKISTEKL